jgi:hypothetical protein
MARHRNYNRSADRIEKRQRAKQARLEKQRKQQKPREPVEADRQALAREPAPA